MMNIGPKIRKENSYYLHVSPHFNYGIYTWKFPPPYHIFEDIQKMSNMRVSGASPYEHFNMLIKQSNKSTSKRLSIRMDEQFITLIPYSSN